MAFLKNIGLDSFHKRKKSEAVEDNRVIKNNSNLKMVDYWHFSKKLKSKQKKCGISPSTFIKTLAQGKQKTSEMIVSSVKDFGSETFGTNHM